VCDPVRLRVGGRPAQVDLEMDRLALAAPVAERADHALERVAGLVDRHEPVRPAPAPARRLGAHRRADQARRLGREGPEARPVHTYEAIVVDDLPSEE
jgi:hypothetical protein